MKGWEWPRAWLDFETIAAALPRWTGTRPYQQIPFQFSLHLEVSDGTITHHEFLSCDGSDPRRACAEALVTMIPVGACVIAYNASFEKRVLRDLAGWSHDLAKSLLALEEAGVDLLPLARAHWYHRDQRGSWSIKAVLPTIAPELDYASLEVRTAAERRRLGWKRRRPIASLCVARLWRRRSGRSARAIRGRWWRLHGAWRSNAKGAAAMAMDRPSWRFLLNCPQVREKEAEVLGANNRASEQTARFRFPRRKGASSGNSHGGTEGFEPAPQPVDIS